MDSLEFHGKPGDEADDLLAPLDVYMTTLFQGQITGQKLESYKKAMFKRALRGTAQMWFEKTLNPADKADWPTLEGKFREFCVNIPSRSFKDAANSRAITNLRRQHGETIHEYVTRVDMIQKTCPPHLQEILLINFLDNMVTAPKDSELRMHIVGRLHTANKMNQFEQFLPGCSYDDVRDMMIFCASSMGYADASKYYREDEQDNEIQANRQVAKNLEALTAELRNTFKPHYRRVAPNSAPVTDIRVCWNCGQQGHTISMCREPRRSAEEINKRRDEESQKRAERTANPHVVGTVSWVTPQMSSRRTPGVQAFPSQVMAASNPVQCGTPSTYRQAAVIPEVVPRAVPNVTVASSGIPFLMPNDPVVAAGRQDKEHKVVKLKVPKKKPADPRVLDYAGSGDDGNHPVPDVPMGEISEPSSQAPIGPSAPESQLNPTVEQPSRVVETRPDPVVRQPGRVVELQPDHVLERQPDPVMERRFEQAPKDANVPSFISLDPERYEEFQAWLEAKNKDSKGTVEKRKRMPAPPIKALKDDDPRYNLREELARHKVDITLAQFLDVSPRMRTEFMRLMQKKEKEAGMTSERVRECVADAVTHVSCATSLALHKALPMRDVKSPALGYVNGQVGAFPTSRILVDGGSQMELISRPCAEKCGTRLYKTKHTLGCRMANDGCSEITHFTMVRVVVGEIESDVYAFVAGGGVSFDLLVGKMWLMSVQGVEDHYRGHLTMKGQDGFEQKVPLASLYPIENPIAVFGLEEYLVEEGVDTSQPLEKAVDPELFLNDVDEDEREEEELGEILHSLKQVNIGNEGGNDSFDDAEN